MSAQRADDPRVRRLAGAGFIVIVTLVAYIPAMRGGFIWDDDTHVTQNAVLTLPDGLALIWLEPGATPQYYPLTHTTFWIERRLWGDHPLGYHIVNVVLQITSALILWRILSLLELRGAWLAAAIFALHPIEVESVAWITERKNVLSGVLYLAAMLAYLRASDSGNRAPHLVGFFLSLALFIAAVLSKTVTASLPAAILLVIWWKRGRVGWQHVLAMLPMLVIAIVMGSITGVMERVTVGATGPEWELSFAQRVIIAGSALWFYAWKLLVPLNLSFVYPRWEIDARVWWQWIFPLAAVLLVLMLWLNRKRTRGPLAAMLFFGGTLFPALGFVNVYPMRYSFVADHFQYLAGIGLIVLFAELATRFLPRAIRIGTPVLLAMLTFRQASMYADERTLWETTLARNPAAWIAHDHLGRLAMGGGDFEVAVGHYLHALELNPDHIEAYIGLGNVYLRSGNVARAADEYRKAIAVRPDKPTPRYALGGALVAAGDIEGAIAAYNDALRVEPRFVPARLKLAEIYRNIGRYEEADSHLRQAQEELRAARGLRL